MQALSTSIGMLLLSVCCLGACSPAPGGPVPGSPDALSSRQNTIEVTYIGNEGFLIEAGGMKILIDALYRKGVSGYVVHPQERRDAMEEARPPFHDVDLVLASHYHADHFDAAAVEAHLRNNPEAMFVSTPQAVERLRFAGGGDESMRGRIVGAHPDEGTRLRKTVNGIELELIRLHHGRTRPVQNLGFLATIGGWTILHIGDTEATIDDFLLYDLAADDIDIAFIPYWFLISDERDDELRRAVPSGRIVVMHVPPRNSHAQHIEELGGWDAMLDRIEKHYPAAVTFRKPMQSRAFSLGSR